MKNIIIEKSVFDGFVKKVNTIDTEGPNSGLFSKTQNSLDKKNLERGSIIPKLQNQVKKTELRIMKSQTELVTLIFLFYIFFLIETKNLI